MNLDTITGLIDKLGDLSPAALCCLVLLVFNLLLRRTPHVKNWVIPWLSIALGMILFPIFLPVATHFRNPIARNIMLGFVIGAAAAFGYVAIVAFAESKWPWLHNVLNPDQPSNDDPTKPHE